MTTAHYRPPHRMDARFNSVVRWLADRGVNLAGAQILTVRGRVTGRPQRIPVNVLRVDGAEYLVSIRGHTHWARNARAAGVAELRRGRRVRTIRLAELPVAHRAPVIRRYLDRWGWEVARFLPDGLTADANADQLAIRAHEMPVFVVD